MGNLARWIQQLIAKIASKILPKGERINSDEFSGRWRWPVSMNPKTKVISLIKSISM